MTAKRVTRLRTAVLAHRDYPGIGRPVAALDFVALELPGMPSPEEAFLREHVRVAPVLRTSGYLAQVEMVRAGLGVALLARQLVGLDPNLTVLELGLPECPALDLWLVCPSSLREVPRVDAVWRALAEALAALEGASQ